MRVRAERRAPLRPHPRPNPSPDGRGALVCRDTQRTIPPDVSKHQYRRIEIDSNVRNSARPFPKYDKTPRACDGTMKPCAWGDAPLQATPHRRGQHTRGQSMPSGCSDHRKRLPKYAIAAIPRAPKIPATFCNSPTDSWWYRTGASAAAFARLDDSIDFHDDRDRHTKLFAPSEPRPAPDVATGWPGAATRLRALSAHKLHVEACTGHDAIAAMPLNEVHGEHCAVHRLLQPGAPGQG